MQRARGLIVGVLMLAGALPCGGQDKPKSKEQRYQQALYPIKQGFRWTYRVTDSKASKSAEFGTKAQHVVISAENEQTFAIKKRNSEGKEYTEEVIGYNLQVAGGGKVLHEQVLVAEDGVYRISGAGKIISPPLCFLKKDARKGETWKVDSQSENAVLKGEFSADEEVVKVPLGEYKTVVVRSRDFQIGAEKLQVEYWFSPNVGMVKQRVRVGNHDVTLELEKIDAK